MKVVGFEGNGGLHLGEIDHGVPLDHPKMQPTVSLKTDNFHDRSLTDP